MHIEKCAKCGKKFKARDYRQKYCSAECRTYAKKIREKEYYKEHAVSAKKETHKICKYCGKEFTTLHNGRKYCGKECRRDANKTLPLGIREFVCEFCGNSFKAEAKRKFCCIECRENAEKADKMRKKPKKPKLSLNQIAKLSRNEGLTYGQYVAKYGL